jgi:glycosyltransferase involved in cell wall biosynthesis
MNIVGLMRVKNEARWIANAIDSLKPFCDSVLVFDDHSTDGTPEICEKSGAIVYRSLFDGLDESRDKNELLGLAADLGATWCFFLDGDEIVEPDSAETIVRLAGAGPDSYTFRFVYLWDRPDQMRVDGVYASMWRHSMFRVKAGQRFARTSYGGNLHCGSAPIPMGRPVKSDVRIFHLGYMLREDRIRKYEWYNSVDPNNRVEDGYKHMVIGDVFPADSAFRYGGPLRLEALV